MTNNEFSKIEPGQIRHAGAGNLASPAEFRFHHHPGVGGPHEHGSGPHGHGPHGGPHGRGPGRGGRARRGAIRAALISLLADGPSNGYGLMKQIEEKTGGVWVPSPGSVYPTLSQLVDEGLVAQTPTEDGKADYALTDEGRAYAQAHAEKLEQVWRREEEESEGARDLREAEHALVHQLRRIRHHGSPEQILEATQKVLSLAQSFSEGTPVE